MKRPRIRLRGRTRRGDGFGTEVSVVTKPELGVRVRVVHSVDGRGQYAFDYPIEGAAELGRDVIGAVKYARGLEAEIAGEPAPGPKMAIPRSRRKG